MSAMRGLGYTLASPNQCLTRGRWASVSLVRKKPTSYYNWAELPSASARRVPLTLKYPVFAKYLTRKTSAECWKYNVSLNGERFSKSDKVKLSLATTPKSVSVKT